MNVYELIHIEIIDHRSGIYINSYLHVELLSGPYLTLKVCLKTLCQNCYWFTKESAV